MRSSDGKKCTAISALREGIHKNARISEPCAEVDGGKLATGLNETIYILDRVKRNTSIAPAVYVKWQPFSSATGGLFVWEAFVTKNARRTRIMKMRSWL